MSWFNSWSDFSKRASDVAKAATEKAAEVAKIAADKSKEVASTVHTKVNTFVEEQKKEYNAVEQESDLSRRQKSKKSQMMDSGIPPWFIDESKDEQQLELLDELRMNILKLCEDEKNFLIKAPNSESVFAFKLEYALPHAQKALALDPILPQIRFKIVPRSVIRESLGVSKMDFSKPPVPTTPRSKSVSSEKQNVDEQMNEEKEYGIKSEDNSEKTEQNEASKSESPQKKDIVESVQDDLSKMDLQKTSSSSEKLTNIKPENVDAVDLNQAQEEELEDDDEFLADDVHIDGLSKEESDKMKKELGIRESNDNENVDQDLENVEDLLADVNTEDVDELSDADLAAELENLSN